jgi:hypothetical protein
MSVEEARAYIAAARWQQCRKPQGGPHQYTHRAWAPRLASEWDGFCGLINTAGTVHPWPKPPAWTVHRFAYLLIDGWVYWGPVPAGLLNRQTLDDARVELGEDFMR